VWHTQALRAEHPSQIQAGLQPSRRIIKKIIRIVLSALQDVWADLWTGLVCNLLWTLSVLLIIPGPPATLALFYYGNRLAHGEAADLGDYWRAFRRNWGTGWRWGAINLVIIAFLAGDAILTGQYNQSTLAQFAQGFYLALLAGWLLVQFYALPFLFEQENAGIRRALRNSTVLIGRNLAFSFGLAGLLLTLMLLGVFLFMLTFAFGGVILASAGNRAVLDRLGIE